MKKVYKNFKVAGAEYYEAMFVIDKLKPGRKLKLKCEPKNIHDENAVAVYYKRYKLGYVPKSANYSISQILKAGWKIFECYVQTVDKKNLEINIAVFVRKK